jgi:hypothetical protein
VYAGGIGTYVAKASALGLAGAPDDPIDLVHADGRRQRLWLARTEKDADGREVVGWRYLDPFVGTRLLITNE